MMNTRTALQRADEIARTALVGQAAKAALTISLLTILPFPLTSCDILGYADYSRSFMQYYIDNNREKELNNKLSLSSYSSVCFAYPGQDVSAILSNTSGPEYYDDLIIISYYDDVNQHVEWLHKDALVFEAGAPGVLCRDKMADFEIVRSIMHKATLRVKDRQ